MSLQDSTQIENVKVLLKVGADGRGIAEIVKVGTSGIVDTYDIVLSDGTRIPFDVTNGSSIDSIEKTATVGLVDTYTITLTNGDTFEFEVTNADGSTAGTVGYDNTDSGLDATNVQDAIDEVNEKAENNSSEISNTQAMIATVQPNLTAVKAYAVGEQFVYQGLLYKATAAISSGGTITINGNCTLADSVTEQIRAHNSSIVSGSVSLVYQSAYYCSKNVTIPSGAILVANFLNGIGAYNKTSGIMITNLTTTSARITAYSSGGNYTSGDTVGANYIAVKS